MFNKMSVRQKDLITQRIKSALNFRDRVNAGFWLLTLSPVIAFFILFERGSLVYEGLFLLLSSVGFFLLFPFSQAETGRKKSFRDSALHIGFLMLLLYSFCSLMERTDARGKQTGIDPFLKRSGLKEILENRRKP